MTAYTRTAASAGRSQTKRGDMVADEKKYYYMRLKDNFFESDSMVVLESVQDGYLYSNILLKLYLRSLKDDGRLMMNNKIPYNAQMIATITRHQVGTVEKALQIFKDMDLIEILDNGAMYMVDIQEFIGKGSSEADRKRTYRRRILSEKTGGGQMSTKCPPEIEIELEIEKELEREAAAACARADVPDGTQLPPSSDDSVLMFYHNNIGKPSQFVKNKIAEYRQLGCKDDLLIYAFTKMAEANASSIGYIVPLMSEAIAQGTVDAASFVATKGVGGYAGRNTAVTRSTQSAGNGIDWNRPRRLKRKE